MSGLGRSRFSEVLTDPIPLGSGIKHDFCDIPYQESRSVEDAASKQAPEGIPHTESNEHEHATSVESEVRSSPEPSGQQMLPQFQRSKRPTNILLPDSSRNDDSSQRIQGPSTKTKNMKEAKLHFIKAVHSAIIEKFISYGVILVLLATITFSGILAPPGSFDSNGVMRPPLLIGCFLFFSTLSFFLACTGLLAVISGTASMFRPGFFLNLDLKFPSPLTRSFQSVSNDQEPPSTTSKSPKEDEELDDPKLLASLVLGNLHRAWRLRVYLVSSLLSCVVAFVCGAFASMDGAENRNKSMLTGAVAVGGVTMGFEIFKSATGLSTSYSGKWHSIFKSIPMLSEVHHHPWEGAVSRVLRNVTPNTH